MAVADFHYRPSKPPRRISGPSMTRELCVGDKNGLLLCCDTCGSFSEVPESSRYSLIIEDPLSPGFHIYCLMIRQLQLMDEPLSVVLGWMGAESRWTPVL